MTPAPEAEARVEIDRLLQAAGWSVQDASTANIHGARGVAIREFPLPGFGFADYLLYLDGKAAGVIEAKKAGTTLTGVEVQSSKYTQGLPAGLPRWHNPLPFCFESTGIETRFTNGLDPEPRSRGVFAFHRPEFLAALLDSTLSPPLPGGEGRGEGVLPLAELILVTFPRFLLHRIKVHDCRFAGSDQPKYLKSCNNVSISLR